MERLTYLDNGEPAYRHNNCVYKNEIATKLYEYENTGLTPEEINVFIADNKRLRKLIDEVEKVVTK